ANGDRWRTAIPVADRPAADRRRRESQQAAGRKADRVVRELRTGVLMASITRRVFVQSGMAMSLLFVMGVSSLHAETIDRVLAVAGGQIITLSDVTAARDFGLVTPAGGADPIRSTLSLLIDRELVLVEVDRYAPPEPSNESIDREIAAMRARFATEAAVDAPLARSGVDERHLRDVMRQNLRIRAYQDQRFAAADS